MENSNIKFDCVRTAYMINCYYLYQLNQIFLSYIKKKKKKLQERFLRFKDYLEINVP